MDREERKRASREKLPTHCAFLSALAAVCQISAGIFPGPGHLLSIMATLPVLTAGYYGIGSGVMTYLATSVLIMALMPAETSIFMLATGLLGLVVGCGFQRIPSVLLVFISGISLGTGITVLVYILSIPALGGLTGQMKPAASIGLIYGFSTCYSSLWIIGTKAWFRKIDY